MHSEPLRAPVPPSRAKVENSPKPNPTVLWSRIQELVFQAFDLQPDEAEKLLDKYQPPYHDQEDLSLALQHLDPKVGVENFEYLNKKVDLNNVMKAKPLDVLEEVLKMVTQSDKWQAEVST
jgi:hypothetical protein